MSFPLLRRDIAVRGHSIHSLARPLLCLPDITSPMRFRDRQSQVSVPVYIFPLSSADAILLSHPKAYCIAIHSFPQYFPLSHIRMPYRLSEIGDRSHRITYIKAIAPCPRRLPISDLIPRHPATSRCHATAVLGPTTDVITKGRREGRKS